jgi:fructoselysine-6-phosphate deglycase
MLNFDEQRFLDSQEGAIALGQGLYDEVARALADGMNSLFFLGAGGAGHLMSPAATLLTRSSTLPTFIESPSELMAYGSVHLNAHSLVVIPSRSGDTVESLDALDFCQRAGARVLALTGTADSPLGTAADVNFTNLVGDENSSESYYLQSLIIALAVMDVRGEQTEFREIFNEMQGLPNALLESKRAFEGRAAELAAVIAASPYHMFIGAGSTWPEAFYYAMCILEEMQWIRTRPVHAADFFHGPLELIEPGVSCILLKGEDESRPLVERVEHFVTQYGDAPVVLDSAELVAGVTDRLRFLISPVVLATVLERVSAHVEVLRNHPLTTRRYYRQVNY